MTALTPWIARGLAMLRSLFQLDPLIHARWEMWLMRIALAYLIVTSVPYMEIGSTSAPRYDSLPVPSSIGAVWDGLTVLSKPDVFNAVRIGFYIALGLYVCGIGTPIALTYLFIVDACLGSLSASQGAHGHSRQTLGLAMMGLAMGSWASVFWKAHGGAKNLLWLTHLGENLVINWGRQMVAAAYCVSAVTKEFNSKGLWFMHSDKFVLSVVKAQEEAVIKGTVITQEASDFAMWMAQQPFLSSCMLLSAWLLEFSAPLMLLNRRIALLIGVLLWIFHAINGWFMGLPFDLNRSLVVVLFMNIPFWIYWMGSKVISLRQPSTPGRALL